MNENENDFFSLYTPYTTLTFIITIILWRRERGKEIKIMEIKENKGKKKKIGNVLYSESFWF